VHEADRETVEQPADWRRSAWGLLIGILGIGGVLSAGIGALSASVLTFGAGMLLLGLAIGWTDPVIAHKQRRLRGRLRDRFSSNDSRA
jgi:choline-glycine betaine transporter